ncbi:MAG TPA: response regulator transcription factor [Ktedonobacterales bacterium]|nr:response regulator transcription factor [Ktedonobacterales bacterium]
MPAHKTVILVAEKDPQALRLLVRTLHTEGYEVSPVKDEQQLFEALETKEPDLILLDTISSESHDFELCRYVRNFSLVPIIAMSAQKQDHTKARALDSGADDYLPKPVSVVELLAQVRAVLRRTQWNNNEHLRNVRPTLTFGTLTIDFLQHQVTIDGRPIALTPTEYRILSYLAQNAGRIVTNNLLLEKVWGAEYVGETNLLKVHIFRLRHKIERDAARPTYIMTKTGLGYCFSAQPERRESATAS